MPHARHSTVPWQTNFSAGNPAKGDERKLVGSLQTGETHGPAGAHCIFPCSPDEMFDTAMH
jgi:hypothetical protein